MSQLFFIILFAIGAIALFVLGYSITYFFRGRHIQTDVGDNDQMKALGLKCTSQEIRENEADLRGVPLSEIQGVCSTADCNVCVSDCDTSEKSS